MVYRVDELTECGINPITGCGYDNSWVVLMLTDSEEYQFMCGSRNNCAYTIKVSRTKYDEWKMVVGDFLSYNEVNAKNIILVMTESEYEAMKDYYKEKYKLSSIIVNDYKKLYESLNETQINSQLEAYRKELEAYQTYVDIKGGETQKGRTAAKRPILPKAQ